MPDQRVVERIDAWAAAGLIDEATASRLRAAEAEAAVPVDGVPMDAHGVGSAPTRSAAASVFGPAVAIGELFAYVGAGFLLAAWHTLFASLFSPESSGAFLTRSLSAQAVQLAVPAIAFAVVGMLALRRGERERRAAGVAFVVATVHVFGALGFAMQTLSAEITIALIVASASAVVAALLFRRKLASVLTQLALLGSLVALAISLLGWLSTQLFPQAGFTDFGPQPVDQGIAELRVLATLAWWILWAAGFGFLALQEARRGASPSAFESERANAHARANFTRFVAGMTAVLGTLKRGRTGESIRSRDSRLAGRPRRHRGGAGSYRHRLPPECDRVSRSGRGRGDRSAVRPQCHVRRGPHRRRGGAAARGRDPDRRGLRRRPPAAPTLGRAEDGEWSASARDP